MDSILYPLLAAVAVMFISLAGVIFTLGEVGKWLQRNLTYLATFAGGVFIIVAWHLAEEALHEGGWIVGLGAVLLGALLMESINLFFPAHHHHGVTHDHAHTHVDGRRVLFSDALHNIGDGILLVAAFASDVYIGLAATVGVLLHEFVQEISEYFVLRESGYTNFRALSLNFTVSASILLGLFLAIFLSSSEILVSILAGLAAGGFLSVLLHDLLPHALASVRTHGRAYAHAVALIAGAGLMFTVQTLTPHEDAHEPEVSNGASHEESIEPAVQQPPSRETAPLKFEKAEIESATSPQIPGTRN